MAPSTGAPISRCKMNRTVADDMLPYSDSTSRDAQTASVDRPSAAAEASRIFGPPGWIAHDLTSATSHTVFCQPLVQPRPQFGRDDFRDALRERHAESVIADGPGHGIGGFRNQVRSAGDQSPGARERFGNAAPTIAPAPSAKSALATTLGGSQP